jgi:hypothetical protein
VAVDSIVDVSISTTATPPSAESFDTALLVGYHNLWPERTRIYSTLTGFVSDGARSSDPLYKMMASAFSQQPRVKSVKVGRRALPFSQVIDLTPAAPSNGKVYSVEVDGDEASYTADADDVLSDVCTALASAINTAAGDGDADAIHTGASTAGIQNITVFNGVVGDDVMAPERALAIVFNTHADWDATVITVTGTDRNGDALEGTVAVPNGGGATVNVVAALPFRTVTNINVPAQTGTNGTFTLGTRARLSASGSSGTKVVVTTTTPGDLITFDDFSSTLTVKDQTADPGIATDLDAILLEDKDFYGVLLDSNSAAEITPAETWTEANKKLMVVQSPDTAIKSAGSTTDIFYTSKASAFFRTTGLFHDSIGTNWIAAGIVGNRFVAKPGSDTWAFKTVAGIRAVILTDTERNAVLGKNGNVYITIAGRNMIYAGLDGKGAKTFGGEWIDVVRGIDDTRSKVQLGVFGSISTQPDKLPLTDAGIDVVRGVIDAELARKVADNFLVSYTISMPLAADLSPTDRANRHLAGVEFSAVLAGAIHAVTITGSITS